ncbi:MAG: hypothetical protein ACE5NP_06665 [Anaerolineae bacterium]
MAEDKRLSEEVGVGKVWQWWGRCSPPLKIGIIFAIIAALMAGVGWLIHPNFAARTLWSFLMAVFISAAAWGVISWAIATAAYDVERDASQGQGEE